MKNAILVVSLILSTVSFARIVDAGPTIVEGGVIHFRGEIVEDPCDFTFLSKNSEIVEKCGRKDPVTYNLDPVTGIKDYISATIKIQYQSLTENLSVVSVIYQ